MGTRAVVSIDEELFVATHWDGYPAGIGCHLLEVHKVEDIIEAVREHSINFVRKDLIVICQVLQPNIKVEDIDNYGDWAEYQYDFNSITGAWKFRKLSGSWPASQYSASIYRPLTEEECVGN